MPGVGGGGVISTASLESEVSPQHLFFPLLNQSSRNPVVLAYLQISGAALKFGTGEHTGKDLK